MNNKKKPKIEKNGIFSKFQSIFLYYDMDYKIKEK